MSVDSVIKSLWNQKQRCQGQSHFGEEPSNVMRKLAVPQNHCWMILLTGMPHLR